MQKIDMLLFKLCPSVFVIAFSISNKAKKMKGGCGDIVGALAKYDDAETKLRQCWDDADWQGRDGWCNKKAKKLHPLQYQVDRVGMAW